MLWELDFWPQEMVLLLLNTNRNFFMKSLIYKNPETNVTTWCVDNVVDDSISIEQYIHVVNFGYIEQKYYKVENFTWVDQPTDVSVSRKTHIWDGSTFVALSTAE